MYYIYAIFYTLIRIFVFSKIFYLFIMTSQYPESHDVSLLTWWIYFLIFDIWLLQMLPDKKTNQENKPNDNDILQ
jgi:hypothetical protein